MKTKLRRGDRVAVYGPVMQYGKVKGGAASRLVGNISYITESTLTYEFGYIGVTLTDGSEITCNPRQCRRLVKRRK